MQASLWKVNNFTKNIHGYTDILYILAQHGHIMLLTVLGPFLLVINSNSVSSTPSSSSWIQCTTRECMV